MYRCHVLPMFAVSVRAEDIHPSLWFASQLAHGLGRVVVTGNLVLPA
ncbi:Uncharacterised protein [Burkholderia pseudomallei]|nr:Uncharacterised protein [Burkholderia pseudomallei]